MALVDYSSSSSESDGQHSTTANSSPTATHNLKRKRPLQTSARLRKRDSGDLPPLPSSFHDLYASTARPSTRDDPSLHGGRKRAVPHIEGNWPSHIYLEWLPSLTEHSKISNLLSAIQERFGSSKDEKTKLNSLLTSPLSTPLPLHISLSAPLTISTEQKDAFLQKLDSTLPKLGRFKVRCTGVHFVSNGEGTRWFLVMRVQKSEGNELNRLLLWSNKICQEFGLDKLYVDEDGQEDAPKRRTPSGKKEADDKVHAGNGKFHFSIAWTLESSVGGDEIDLDASLRMRQALQEVKSIEVYFDSLKVKIGNIVTSLMLEENDKRADVRGILG